MSSIPILVTPESQAPKWQLQTLIGLFAVNGCIVSIVGAVLIWVAAIQAWARGEANDPMVAAVAFGVGAVFLALAALAFASSWGLHRRRDWALTTSYVTCAFQALFFPVGTVLSAFGWWVLSRTSFETA